jgi:hypothetical protein
LVEVLEVLEVLLPLLLLDEACAVVALEPPATGVAAPLAQGGHTQDKPVVLATTASEAIIHPYLEVANIENLRQSTGICRLVGPWCDPDPTGSSKSRSVMAFCDKSRGY